MQHALQEAVRKGWRDDGKLPPQWEELADDTSGKKFFVDHANQTTSWVDPRDYLRKPHSFEECIGTELPYGWEEEKDPELGIYFINHNEWTTQLDDPRVYSNAHEQRRQLQEFLRQTEAKVAGLRARIRITETTLKSEYQQLAAIHAKLRLEKLSGEEPSLELRQLATDTEVRIRMLEEELALLRQEMDYDIQGVKILQEVSRKTAGNRAYTVEDARKALREIQRIKRLSLERSQEKMDIERSLIEVSGQQQQDQYGEAHRLEMEALRARQQQELADLKTEYENAGIGQAGLEEELDNTRKEAWERENSFKVFALIFKMLLEVSRGCQVIGIFACLTRLFWFCFQFV
jgi:hypothetical protein